MALPRKIRRLRVLYIDDEPDNLATLTMTCGKRWDITELAEPRPVYTRGVRMEDFDVLFLDLVLYRPGEGYYVGKPADPTEGLKVLSWVHLYHPRMPVLIVTGVADRDLKKQLEATGPWIRYYEKPVSFLENNFIGSVEDFVETMTARGSS